MIRLGWKLFLSLSFFGVIFLVGFYVKNSDLFLIKIIEVDVPQSDIKARVPLTPDNIKSLSSLPLMNENLFTLNLRIAESEILKHPWVQSVRIEKKFPQTLWISPTYRTPVALFHDGNADLKYIDRSGQVFGSLQNGTDSDLPILTGISKENALAIQLAIELIDLWQKSSLHQISQISNITWNDIQGLRTTITYQIQLRNQPPRTVRSLIEFGDSLESPPTTSRPIPQAKLVPSKISRLFKVLQYLKSHSILVRQIWAESGKKVVVRTAYGS